MDKVTRQKTRRPKAGPPLTRVTDRELFLDAKKFIPGGVNSPVRSFRAVGGTPVFIKEAAGARLLTETGRSLLDYCLSWGALILGHAYPEVVESIKSAAVRGTSFGAVTRQETEFAALIADAVPSVKKVRLTSSGTEAVMSAVRLARGYTGRNKIIKFEGAYHGHADHLLAKAGSGALTLGVPDSLGVPPDFARHTIVAPFNDKDQLRALIAKERNDIAAVIVEPVQANCGVILPDAGFLDFLRKITEENGILLIFDEVITGFRLSYGGAQGIFNVKPDLTCFGKIIGGGLPVGAFGGKEKIMDILAPVGGVYQAGTLSGNPLTVAAGMATLKVLKRLDPYDALEKKTRDLCEGIKHAALERKKDVKVNHIGSMFSVFFSEKDIRDYRGARSQSTERFGSFSRAMLEEGIYLAPSAFETNFLSVSHSGEDIKNTIKAAAKALEGRS